MSHLSQLGRACLREQPLSRTASLLLFLAFAFVEVVLGFQDNCNCLVLSGFLHVCHVIDQATHWLPQHYHAVPGAPQGFNRAHLLVRLANLYLMAFLCFDCIIEAIVDFRKFTNMRPTTVPLILLASLVLHMLSSAAGASVGVSAGGAGVVDRDLSGSPAAALFGSASASSSSRVCPSWLFTWNWGSSSHAPAQPTGIVDSPAARNVPSKVGSVGFFVFAIIQYVIPHDHPTRWADSVVTIVAAVAVLARASPGLRNHTLFFMQATARHKRGVAQACLQQVEGLAGVIEYHSERFWVAVPGTHVASLCIRLQVLCMHVYIPLMLCLPCEILK